MESLHRALSACSSPQASASLPEIEAQKTALRNAGASSQSIINIGELTRSLQRQCSGVPRWMVFELDEILLQATRAGSVSAARYLFDKYRGSESNPTLPEDFIALEMMQIVGARLESLVELGNPQAAMLLAEGLTSSTFRSERSIYSLLYMADVASRGEASTALGMWNRYRLQMLENTMTAEEIAAAREEARHLLASCCNNS